MIDLDIKFYDIITTSSIGLLLFIFGLYQISIETVSYGMIGYTFHRVYTIIGLLQLGNTIKLLDYNNDYIRIITQWFMDLQSMTIIIGMLIFNAYIIILSKNILSNAMQVHWYQLDKIYRIIHYFLIGITILSSNGATILRFLYRYEFWTIIIILSNTLCLLFVTLCLHYYLHKFFKHTDIILGHMNMRNDKLFRSIHNMHRLRIIYTMSMIPIFYFFGYYIYIFFTTDTYNLNNFNNNISYLRYIILFGCIVMCWLTYIKKQKVDRSPIIIPRKASNDSARMYNVVSGFVLQ